MQSGASAFHSSCRTSTTDLYSRETLIQSLSDLIDVSLEMEFRLSSFSQHAAAIGLCDIFRWNGMIEAIDDADGLGAFVGDDLRGA